MGPQIAAHGKISNALGLAKNKSVRPLREEGNNNMEQEGNQNGLCEMNSTRPHGHCYGLIEDCLLSLVHQRMPPPRKDTDAEAYSPTLGGIWGIYRHSGRQLAEGRLVEDATDDTRHDV